MESFTSWDHWQYGPFDLKPYADRALADGTNHFTFHTSPHRPRDAGLPGWAYHAGTHIAPSIVWWPKAGPFMDYLSRCCFLLQQGLFVGDVCYYYGDNAYNFVPPKQVDPSLGPGYDYDVTNAEVLLNRMDVRHGRIVLPDGLSYELLALPDRDDVDVDVLRKVGQLVRGGATLVGRKPSRSNGLKDFRRRDTEVRQLAEQIWGPCDGNRVLEHRLGEGRVIWGRSLRDVLQSRGIGPDFTFAARDGQAELDYIHRRVGGSEVYFVVNRKDRWTTADCVFRVRGKAPEFWMPDTGEVRKAAVFRARGLATEVPLHLPPFGSVFVVFREEATQDHVVRVGGPEGGDLAAPAGAPPLELCGREGPRAWRAVIRRAGRYRLETARGETFEVAVERLPPPQAIRGPWTVRFPAGWGAPESALFDRLMSWTDHGDEGIKYFSGIATYEADFELASEIRPAGRRLYLDLGRVQKVADVAVNGARLGILWKPPYCCEITGAVRSGRNRLTIEVANTWSNRLVGDAHAAEGKRYCRTNITGSKKPWRDVPLLESGLLGPVQLTSAQEVDLPHQPSARASNAMTKAEAAKNE